jgi:hypothetical protein
MKRLVMILSLAAWLALATSGPALAWDQCTQHWVRGQDGVTRICDLCCRTTPMGRVCQWFC